MHGSCHAVLTRHDDRGSLPLVARGAELMLLSLHIRNFAIIEDVTLEFGPGLTVLSGETGAGKSIIIQALGLLLGQRGSSEWIRKGEEAATVTGLFDVEGRTDIEHFLRDQGIPCDDGELLIQRSLSVKGRNQIRLNGVPSTVALLSRCATALVDIVSQREHEALLKPEVQRDILDQFGHLAELCSSYRATLEAYQRLQTELEALQRQDSSSRELEEFLRFQVKEIADARLQSGEDEELKSRKSRVRNAARLGELCQFSEEMIGGGEGSVLQNLSQLELRLGKATELDPQLERYSTLVQSARVELEEVVASLSDYLSTLQFEPGELETLEQRLAEIDRLKRKYGGSIEEILQQAEELKSRLSDLEDFDDRAEDMRVRLVALGGELAAAEKKLQTARVRAGKKLETAVTAELQDLGMEHAEFSVCWEDVTAGVVERNGRCYDRFGSKRAVFFIAPNPGEDAKPLARIASGGERSRILLALNKVLVEYAGTATSIYDEVDEGVGGATASQIGTKLKEIGKKRQVICISHQAQIAVCGDRHFAIVKRIEAGRVRTGVHPLVDRERELEIARMIGGASVTEQAREHARDLLKKAAS